MNQVNVDNAMKEIITTLGNKASIFADEGEICVSVILTNCNKMENILYRNGIDFKKEEDDIDGLVVSYTFEGEYE